MRRMAQDIRVTEPRLKAVVKAIFAAAGSDERECGLAADHLVEANLRGHDSHGVGHDTRLHNKSGRLAN